MQHDGNPRLGQFGAMLVAEYEQVREALLASFPDDDPADLIDTLDGETQLPDVVAGMIRRARLNSATEDALGAIIKEMSERKARIAQRTEQLRSGAFRLMQAADMAKLERPDFTASIGKGRASVAIVDDAAIPTEFLVTRISPDKTKIGDALKAGIEVAGAELVPASPTLVVRVR